MRGLRGPGSAEEICCRARWGHRAASWFLLDANTEKGDDPGGSRDEHAMWVLSIKGRQCWGNHEPGEID
tara:strand:+ start:145 stop:351 length:207 start_codon:yes stop_codon:yes gene_type:complete